jgi:hypothetical protein
VPATEHCWDTMQKVPELSPCDRGRLKHTALGHCSHEGQNNVLKALSTDREDWEKVTWMPSAEGISNQGLGGRLSLEGRPCIKI